MCLFGSARSFDPGRSLGGGREAGSSGNPPPREKGGGRMETGVKGFDASLAHHQPMGGMGVDADPTPKHTL